MENIDFVTLLVHLVGGAIGALLIGAIIRGVSLGALGNLVAGLIGGGVAGHILTPMLALPAIDLVAGIDPVAVAIQAASGAAGGIVATIVLGLMRCLFGGRG